ncbi:MAG: type II and III secretion system protein [Endomicrobia bacterium]|nr:type II and III secretion system protein [Endomicrobiia bacterium]
MKKLIFIPVLFVVTLAYAQKTAVPVPEKAEKMVEISVEVTEINENKSIELGIEWPSRISAGEATHYIIDGKEVPIKSFPLAESGKWFRTEGSNFIATLRALENAGAAKILSKPKLVTKSSSTAKFIVGGEFPIVAYNPGGASTIEWKEYGIIMNITPVVMNDGKIDIQLQAEVSRLDFTRSADTDGRPIIAKRQASSHLQLKDGETMVLAGLIETTKSNSRKGVPILCDIPILGALFSVQTYDDNKTNVLIFVTTKILE